MTQELSIATYNIEFSKQPKQVIRNIRELSRTHDIFCLQEVLRIPGQDFIVDRLTNSLGINWETEHFIGDDVTEPGILGHGVAVLWDSNKYNKQSVTKLNLPKMQKLSPRENVIERALGFAGKPIQRRALSVTYQTPSDETVRVTSVHLDSMGGAQNRRNQAKFLLSELEKQESVNQEVICGDFNTNSLINKRQETGKLREIFSRHGFTESTVGIPWTADLLNSDFGGRRKLLERSVKTFNLHLRQKFDYIWTRGFMTTEASRINLPGSDHYPVVARLIKNQ